MNRARILISKIGLDYHEAGAKLVASWLKNTGFEVIYLGLFQPPNAIASAAIQEDVDLIGVSSTCGAHVELTAELMKELKQQNVNIPVIIGGVIPKQDIPVLMELGVKGVFPSGASMNTIVNSIKEILNLDK